MLSPELFRETSDTANIECWERERTANATGCSLRETQAILRLFGVHRSHQAIFQWVHRVAEDALGRLREVEETDPNEEVRHAASVAIGEIESQ